MKALELTVTFFFFHPFLSFYNSRALKSHSWGSNLLLPKKIQRTAATRVSQRSHELHHTQTTLLRCRHKPSAPHKHSCHQQHQQLDQAGDGWAKPLPPSLCAPQLFRAWETSQAHFLHFLAPNEKALRKPFKQLPKGRNDAFFGYVLIHSTKDLCHLPFYLHCCHSPATWFRHPFLSCSFGTTSYILLCRSIFLGC